MQDNTNLLINEIDVVLDRTILEARGLVRSWEMLSTQAKNPTVCDQGGTHLSPL